MGHKASGGSGLELRVIYPPATHPLPLSHVRERGTRHGGWVRTFGAAKTIPGVEARGAATGNTGIYFELALNREVI